MNRVAALLMAAVVATPLIAADDKAGSDCLAVGSKVGAFYVTDVTGPAAGDKLCYRCRFKDRPVVSIFVRDVDDNVAKLVKEVDESVAKNEQKGMAAFVVLLTENPEEDAKKLKALAEQQQIKHVPLTTFDGEAGPPSYKVPQESNVSVMMWVEGTLKVNENYKKGEFAGDKVANVVEKTSAILN